MHKPPEPTPEPPALPDDDLDRALACTLKPPPLPDSFRLGVMVAMQQELMNDLSRRRAELEASHRAQQAHMRQDYVRLRRDTLALGVGLAFSCGALSAWALPWLQTFTGMDAAHLMPSLAVAVAALTTVGVWGLRLGRE